MHSAKLIEIVRDKGDADDADIKRFIDGIGAGDISDAQIAAFAMAVYLNGMAPEMAVGLTKAMRDSGDVLTWPEGVPVLDKHSTGGVGDVVSLALAPALAVLGVRVPMISGRGLGHTGGTLDKLEAIPGFQSDIDTEQFQAQVNEIGCAIIGQTAHLAPADKRIYAVRDVTGTVASPALITASILSKKLAAGLAGLVLDIKCGSGAFMQSYREADALARQLVETANAAGCQTRALITNMNTPLASAAGNAVEVRAVIDLMTDADAEPHLREIVVALGAKLLVGAGLVESEDLAMAEMHTVLADGRAATRFWEMVRAQGAAAKDLDALKQALPVAPVSVDVEADREGLFCGFEARAVGELVIELGGGRRKAEDRIDYSVGVSDMAQQGPVQKGQKLARIHARTTEEARMALTQMQSAAMWDVPQGALILGEI